MENLKDKAISIKGKEYVLVKDRVIAFNEEYPNGSIITELVENEERVTIKATVTPDVDKPARYFTGYSQAVWGQGNINTTAATENCETSAVGRALAMMGIGVIESLASADEVHKAINDPRSSTNNATRPYVTPQETKLTDADDPLKTFGGREVTSVPKNTLCAGCGNPFIPKTPTATKCLDCWKKDNPR